MTAARAERTDGELVDLCLAGNRQAFAEIVRRHKVQIYRIVVRLVGDEDEALDILQEAFVSAHAALRRYDKARPMRAWLTRIAINKARDWRRRRIVRRLIWAILPIEHAADTPDDTPSPEIAASDRQELARVAGAIGQLPANLREVLILRTLEGQSQAEAAEILGISEKAIETRLYRARRTLTERLESSD